NLEAGRDVILEIELQGAMQVQKIFPQVKLIFITTRNAETLEARLRGRQTEKEEKIIKRLTQATVEADGIESYQYVIVNDDLDQAVAELRRDILDEEAPSPDREKIGLVRKLQADLKVRLGLV
ncbi:MAG: guanylate kinase, partial [Lachnospiraceae bacterium]